MSDTATDKAIRKHDDEMAETLMQRRLGAFYEGWCPKDHRLAHEFSVELHMLVRGIYAEASEPANKQLMRIVECLPAVLPTGSIKP